MIFEIRNGFYIKLRLLRVKTTNALKKNKIPEKKRKSRAKKDVIIILFFGIISLSTINFYSFIENNSLELLFWGFDVEYLSSDDSNRFRIEGSTHVANTMELTFTCHVPLDTKKVWVRFSTNQDKVSQWMAIKEARSFTLTSTSGHAYLKSLNLYLNCDSRIGNFTTLIYKQDLPLLRLSCASEITLEESNCSINIKPFNTKLHQESWANRDLKARIKLRNSKNGFELELKNNEKLLNMREDDDWLLLPSRGHASALRMKLALDVYNSLGAIDPLCIVSNAEPVELYMNEKYVGLYLLVERADQKLFNLQGDDPENSNDPDNGTDLLFKGENWEGEGKTDWNQLFPRGGDFRKYPEKLDRFIRTASDEQFFNNQSGIFTMINRTQLTDYILFGLLAGHDSLEGNKLYLIGNTGKNSHYYFTPWDFDISWGFSRTSKFNFDNLFDIKKNIPRITKLNHLFYRLFFTDKNELNKHFIEDIKTRWVLLRSSVWHGDSLNQTFNLLYDYMRSGLLRSDKNEDLEMIRKEISKGIVNRVDKFDFHFNNTSAFGFHSRLPSVYIIYDGTIKRSTYINCTFELYQSFPYYECNLIDSKIKYRGRSNWNKAKSGYRLELSKKRALLGMRDDDDWALFAMLNDFTRMRIKLAFDLWRSLSSTNPTAILPDSRYVNLFLNNEYKGLYLLAEKEDKKLFGLNDSQDNINSSLIFNTEPYANYNNYSKDDWKQEWPDLEVIDLRPEILPDLIDFINNSADVDFFDPENGIYSKFDKLNLIDFFIFNFFILHHDFWNFNYFIVRDTYPSKLYLVPWDYDDSFGQRGWYIYNFADTSIYYIERTNKLYCRLLNNMEFMQDCSQRWKELREDLWTENFILTLLSRNHKTIKDVLYTEMYEFPWKPITVDEDEVDIDWVFESTEEFDLDKYINLLYEFIPKRLEVVDSYFNSF